MIALTNGIQFLKMMDQKFKLNISLRAVGTILEHQGTEIEIEYYFKSCGIKSLKFGEPKIEIENYFKSCGIKSLKGAGSFHIHRKTMKDLWALAVLGVREQPNLAQNLVTHSQ